MKELRQGVKLKKVQEQPFNTLPTEFSLTPFEMLMQDIRARKFQLRKVMVRVAVAMRRNWLAHDHIPSCMMIKNQKGAKVYLSSHNLQPQPTAIVAIGRKCGVAVTSGLSPQADA